jgi:hypothetical protein
VGLAREKTGSHCIVPGNPNCMEFWGFVLEFLTSLSTSVLGKVSCSLPTTYTRSGRSVVITSPYLSPKSTSGRGVTESWHGASAPGSSRGSRRACAAHLARARPRSAGSAVQNCHVSAISPSVGARPCAGQRATDLRGHAGCHDGPSRTPMIITVVTGKTNRVAPR